MSAAFRFFLLHRKISKNFPAAVNFSCIQNLKLVKSARQLTKTCEISMQAWLINLQNLLVAGSNPSINYIFSHFIAKNIPKKQKKIFVIPPHRDLPQTFPKLKTNPPLKYAELFGRHRLQLSGPYSAKNLRRHKIHWPQGQFFLFIKATLN